MFVCDERIKVTVTSLCSRNVPLAEGRDTCSQQRNLRKHYTDIDEKYISQRMMKQNCSYLGLTLTYDV